MASYKVSPKVSPDVENSPGDGVDEIHHGGSKAIIEHYKSAGLTLTMPTNTFSMAALFPALFPFEDDEDMCRFVSIVIIALGQYWVTMSISIIYIVYVQDLWKDEEKSLKRGACTKTSPLLMYTSLYVFTCAMLADIRETFEIARYIKHIPRAEGMFATLGFHKGKDGQLSFVEGDGLSLPHKIAVYVFVALPKFVIALLLLVFGAWYILESTSNSFVFLHTLSLTFVLRVDNIVYEIFNSREHQSLLKALPKIKVLNPNRRQKFFAHYGFIMAFVFVPVCVYVLFLSAVAQDMPECQTS